MPSDQEYLQSAGIQDTGEAQTPETPQATQPETPPTPEEMFSLGEHKFPVTSEFQFVHGGQNLKVPYSKLINTYRQAAHMQDKWGEFKKLHTDFEGQRKDYDRYKTFYDKYGQLQEWSEKNPDQWNALYEMYQNRDKLLMQNQLQQPGQPQGFNAEPFINEIAGLKKQMSEWAQTFQQMKQSEEQAREQKNVEFVKTEVQGFAKEFPEIDITEKDLDGIPLWSKIVDWGNQNGFQEFTPAAYMYLKQRIAETYQARARSEAMKSAKDQHKEGIVARSATPITGQKPKQADIKKMSYAEIAELAKSGAMTGT